MSSFPCQTISRQHIIQRSHICMADRMHNLLYHCRDRSKWHPAIEKGLYGNFVGSIEHSRSASARLQGLIGKSQARKPF